MRLKKTLLEANTTSTEKKKLEANTASTENTA